MPTTSEPEYRVLLSVGTHPASDAPALVVAIETVREFTSFGYQLALTSVPAPSQQTYEVRIGGMSLPSVGRPQPGPARGEVMEALPADGTYHLVVSRKTQRAECRFTIAQGQIGALEAGDEGGLTTFEIGAR